MPISGPPERSYCTCTSLRNQIVCYRLSLIPIRWRPDPRFRSPGTDFLLARSPRTSVHFPNVPSSSMFFEGYVRLSVPHVSACPHQFTVFTRILERSCCISSDLAALSEAIFEREWEREKAGFGAQKPADLSVESAREKATKQGDQKASHRPIDVSLGRATRASEQRTTRTVWTGKEPLWKTSQRPHQKLWKKIVGTKGYPAERSLSIRHEKTLEKPFKSKGKRESWADGKSLFERLRTRRKHGSFVSFFEGEVEVSLANHFLLIDDTVPTIHRKRLSSLLSAHEKL